MNIMQGTMRGELLHIQVGEQSTERYIKFDVTLSAEAIEKIGTFESTTSLARTATEYKVFPTDWPFVLPREDVEVITAAL